MLTLLGFGAGAVLGTFHMPFWWGVPSLGAISLGERLGWLQAVALQLVLFALIWAAVRRVELRRGVPAPRGVAEGGWRRLVHGPWSLVAGGVALAFLNALTLLLAGHAWSITWGVTLPGAKLLRGLGVDLSGAAFWRGDFTRAALEAPLLADVNTVMNLGIVLGAFLGAGLAGRFAPARRFPLRVAAAALLGGLLLGYGARIAYGCNIGAYFSAIASTSLHGWLWGLAALAGTPVGVRLRRLFGVERAASC